jgi:hypothetical protein
MFAAFFAIRKGILLFLQTENLLQELQREVQDMGFIHFLTFLADLMSHLNVLNFKLQSKGQYMSDLVAYNEELRKKLNYLKMPFKK